MAVAIVIVRKADMNLLAENGGPIIVTRNWAKSLLYKMNLVTGEELYCKDDSRTVWTPSSPWISVLTHCSITIS